MARTYRRKTERVATHWLSYSTEEEFNTARDIWLVGHPKPPRPKLPPLPKRCWYFDDPVFKSVQNQRNKLMRDWYSSAAYRNYEIARRFSEYGAGTNTFAEYTKRYAAIQRSDHGFGTRDCKSAPSEIANVYSQRPGRQLDRRLIKQGMFLDNWDELNFYKYVKDAAWNYW